MEFNPQFSKIGEILIHNGKITESGVNEGLAHQKTNNQKIGLTLIEMGLIDEDDFVWGLFNKKVYSTIIPLTSFQFFS